MFALHYKRFAHTFYHNLGTEEKDVTFEHAI